MHSKGKRNNDRQRWRHRRQLGLLQRKVNKKPKQRQARLRSSGATTGIQLERACRSIPHFKGVFMRDGLLWRTPRTNECAIVNLDDSYGPGTHWVAYIKKQNRVEYFDSFGNLRPPLELIEYFNRGGGGDGGLVTIVYNYEALQHYDTSNCGQLCVKFLRRNTSAKILQV